MLIINPQLPYKQDFYDDSVNVFSTIGQGPVGPKGDQGDDATDEQVYDQVGEFISDHPEYVTSVVDGSISTRKIVDGAVTTDKLAVASITSDKLDNQAVTTAKLANGSVTNAKLADGAITTIKLADNAVTHNKMADRSVGNDELIDGSVTTNKLADGAVTTAKLANSSVTYGKLNEATLPTMDTNIRGIARVGAGLAMNGSALELDGSGDIATAVQSWLDAHPEATTTVQDGSVTRQKIASDLNSFMLSADFGIDDSVIMPYEQGGMTSTGINAAGTTRLRSAGFYKVTAGEELLLAGSWAGEGGPQHSIKFYSDNDYELACLSSSDSTWTNTLNRIFTVPDGARYMRLLVRAIPDGGTLDPEDLMITFVTASDRSFIVDVGHQHNDFNDYLYGGIYAISGSGYQNSPSDDNRTRIFEIFPYTNGAIVQRITYPITNDSYIRIKSTNNIWSEWMTPQVNLRPAPYSVGTFDLNDYTSVGTYFLSSGVHAHQPNTQIGGAILVEVFESSPGFVVQRITYFNNLSSFWRKYANGTWSEWFGNSTNILFTSPIPTEIELRRYIRRGNDSGGRVWQDIAVYDGHIFDMYSSVMSVDGGEEVEITNGHGNNAMFGVELHGDFPYLYCGSFTQNTCKVYVNQVTTNSAALVRTISFDGMTGYLNSCVDEPNGRIYILLNTTSSTYDGVIDFVVANLSDGSIISRQTLGYTIPIVQGMEFHNGKIYVVSGNGSSSYPDHVSIIDTDGTLVAKSEPLYPYHEFEGVSFDKGNIYIATAAVTMSAN